jgi:hypothetical protein
MLIMLNIKLNKQNHSRNISTTTNLIISLSKVNESQVIAMIKKETEHDVPCHKSKHECCPDGLSHANVCIILYIFEAYFVLFCF